MNKLIFSALLLGITVSGSAATITSYTGSGNPHNGVGYGQSVTTPTGGPWDTITFNFMNSDGAYAIGGLYVLTETYSGTPGGLSSSTAGYLGFTSTINDNIWDFTGVTLNPGTQYFFYMNSIVPLGQVVNLLESGGPYAGGDAFGAGGAGSYISVAGADMVFVLGGNAVSSAPEPGTLALMAGAAAMVAVVRRRRVF